MYNRYLEKQVREAITEKHKSVLINGPRQVGKTTLVKSLLRPDRDVYFTCDDVTVAKHFTASESNLRALVGKFEWVVIDEAQRMKDAGLVIKLLIDTFPEKRFIVTGSSALELAYGTFDALTGRVFTFSMYPLAVLEILADDSLAALSSLEKFLKYGTYPEVLHAGFDEEKQRVISGIASQYLFKDTLNFEMKKDTDFLENLVAILASQTGSLVAQHSLAKTLEVGRGTIDRYLYLLTKLFIIFQLRPYHNNFKKRLTAQSKFFFWDIGIRNTLLRNFGDIDIRSDKGGLWENFIILERMKYNDSRGFLCNYYFYKGENGHEVDLIEEQNGNISCYEIKYSESKVSRGAANVLTELGKTADDLEIINKHNYLSYISGV